LIVSTASAAVPVASDEDTDRAMAPIGAGANRQLSFSNCGDSKGDDDGDDKDINKDINKDIEEGKDEGKGIIVGKNIGMGVGKGINKGKEKGSFHKHQGFSSGCGCRLRERVARAGCESGLRERVAVIVAVVAAVAIMLLCSSLEMRTW